MSRQMLFKKQSLEKKKAPRILFSKEKHELFLCSLSLFIDFLNTQRKKIPNKFSFISIIIFHTWLIVLKSTKALLINLLVLPSWHYLAHQFLILTIKKMRFFALFQCWKKLKNSMLKIKKRLNLKLRLGSQFIPVKSLSVILVRPNRFLTPPLVIQLTPRHEFLSSPMVYPILYSLVVQFIDL